MQQRFIRLYVPTVRSLLATYDFGISEINNDPQQRNSLLLDLNAGLDLFAGPAFNGDPNAFTKQSRVTIIYGTNPPIFLG